MRVRYLDRDGGAHDEVKRGLTAGTFQHECDHLDGDAVPRPRPRHPTLHDVGAVRALPPRRVRRAASPSSSAGSVRDDAATGASWRGSAATPSRPVCRSTSTVTASPTVRPAVTEPPATATRLAGLTLPGLANAHSHAFHRALRGAPSRRRLVLDVARADVRGGRAARRRSRTTGSPRPCSPRWRSPASRASASSTTCTTT